MPFYCPALAWANARPWMVHVSRIRRVALVEPHTPGAYIEELSSSEELSDDSSSDDDGETYAMTDAHVEELWEIID